ncbi:MAG: hypothetical protein ACJAWL_003293 [Motiliproteus sp.]
MGACLQAIFSQLLCYNNKKVQKIKRSPGAQPTGTWGVQLLQEPSAACSHKFVRSSERQKGSH